MQEEAEKFAEEDKKKKESIEVVNQAESYTKLKTLEHKEKITEDISKPMIAEKVESIKELLKIQENKNVEALKTAIEELIKKFKKLDKLCTLNHKKEQT